MNILECSPPTEYGANSLLRTLAFDFETCWRLSNDKAEQCSVHLKSLDSLGGTLYR